MKFKKLITFIMLIFLLSGCVNEVDFIDTSETTTNFMIESESRTEQPLKIDNYTTIKQSDEQSELTSLVIDEINIPENASLNDYYVYDNKVVYTYDYFDYVLSKIYLDHVEEENFGPRICIYDINTKSSEVIYAFDDSMKKCNIEFYDGNKIILSQYNSMGQMMTAEMYMIEMPEINLKKFDIGSDNNINSIVVMGEYIVWNVPDSDKNTVYKYDYTTGNTEEIIKSVSSDMVYYNTSEAFITMCDMKEEGSTDIFTYDLNGNEVNKHTVKDIVFNILGNDKCVVWKSGSEIYVYDFRRYSTTQIAGADSCMIYKDYVIASAADGVYSYKLGYDSQKCITKLKTDYRYFTRINHDGQLCLLGIPKNGVSETYIAPPVYAQ